MLSSNPPANVSADTYGWDTVFALKVGDVNDAIRIAKSSPPDFFYTSPDDWTAKATFSNWQIASTGDGKLIHFALPITSGSLTINSKEHTFSNAQAVIELELDFFESTSQPEKAADGKNYDLKVKTQASAGKNKIATVLSIDFKEDEQSFVVESLLPDALESWLNEHLSIFDHIFATVNLNKYIATGQFAWVVPTATDYAFMSKEPAAESVLGVLCMTEKRSIQGLTPQLSPVAIPPSSRAGYLVSKSRFLEKLIKPSMPFAFKGAQVSDFDLSTDGNSLVLQHQNLSFTVEHDGKSYDATLEEMSITVEANTVKLYARSTTPVDSDVTAHCESTHIYKIVLQNKPNGAPTLVYQETGDPLVKHWTTQGDDTLIEKIILGIIAALLVIILGILTAGAAFVAGAFVIGLLMGLAIESPDIMQVIGQDDAPDIGLLTLNVTDPIVWPGQDVFELNWAGINGVLQLGGTFHPKQG